MPSRSLQLNESPDTFDRPIAGKYRSDGAGQVAVYDKVEDLPKEAYNAQALSFVRSDKNQPAFVVYLPKQVAVTYFVFYAQSDRNFVGHGVFYTQSASHIAGTLIPYDNAYARMAMDDRGNTGFEMWKAESAKTPLNYDVFHFQPVSSNA